MTAPFPPLPPLPESDSEPAQLLDQLLQSLFDDFSFWFQRGLVLLELTPDSLLPASEQQSLRQKLEEALQATAGTHLGHGAECHRYRRQLWRLRVRIREPGYGQQGKCDHSKRTGLSPLVEKRRTSGQAAMGE